MQAQLGYFSSYPFPQLVRVPSSFSFAFEAAAAAVAVAVVVVGTSEAGELKACSACDYLMACWSFVQLDLSVKADLSQAS